MGSFGISWVSPKRDAVCIENSIYITATNNHHPLERVPVTGLVSIYFLFHFLR